MEKIEIELMKYQMAKDVMLMTLLGGIVSVTGFIISGNLLGLIVASVCFMASFIALPKMKSSQIAIVKYVFSDETNENKSE